MLVSGQQRVSILCGKGIFFTLASKIDNEKSPTGLKTIPFLPIATEPRDCHPHQFARLNTTWASSYCPLVAEVENTATSACIALACEKGGNVINHQGGTCQVRECTGSDLQLDGDSTDAHVFIQLGVYAHG